VFDSVEPAGLLLAVPCLLVLGAIAARSARRERMLRGRLALLKQISKFSNPRFGMDRTLGSNMERLRTFYQADSCLTVFADWGGAELQLRATKAGDPDAACRPQSGRQEFAEQLTSLPGDRAINYARRSWWMPLGRWDEYDVAAGERIRRGNRLNAEAIASLLDSPSFITTPLYCRGDVCGRLYLTSRRRPFRASDVNFLSQAVDQIVPVLENVRLADRLASTAAEEERRRIARDIHDSIIQPYIGLQIGLSSVYQKLVNGGIATRDAEQIRTDLELAAGRIQKLIEMTGTGVADLRDFVNKLKGGAEREGDIIALLSRFALRFGEATGISAQVEADGPVSVNDRLAGEVFHIVAEGLSNVRRHTNSCRATVRLACRDDKLVVRIENDSDGNGLRRTFTPRSIAERAEWLLGKTSVDLLEGGGTALVVEIPL
jgi:hypothetical protein